MDVRPWRPPLTAWFRAAEPTAESAAGIALDDVTDEPNETLTVVLQNPTGNSVVGSLSRATLWLVDDE